MAHSSSIKCFIFFWRSIQLSRSWSWFWSWSRSMAHSSSIKRSVTSIAHQQAGTSVSIVRRPGRWVHGGPPRHRCRTPNWQLTANQTIPAMGKRSESTQSIRIKQTSARRIKHIRARRCCQLAPMMTSTWNSVTLKLWNQLANQC